MKLSVGILLICFQAFAQWSSTSVQSKAARAWLGSCSDPATIDVTGVWTSRDWGVVRLDQTENGRVVTGYADGWNITGVVSGNAVCLFFTTSRGVIHYSAKLATTGSGQLSGKYSIDLLGKKGKSIELLK